MATAQERFLELQAKWAAAHDKALSARSSLVEKYGATWQSPMGKRDRLARLRDAEEKAMEAVFAWLDAHSPRNWRHGVPAHWACRDLTYADAVTRGPLSVIPPVSYGGLPSDSMRFAAAV